MLPLHQSTFRGGKVNILAHIYPLNEADCPFHVGTSCFTWCITASDDGCVNFPTEWTVNTCLCSIFISISHLRDLLEIGCLSLSPLTPTPVPFRGDNVSMLIHTYPHKPLRKIKVTICNHQADSPLYLWPGSDLVICKFRKKLWYEYMTMNALTETRCN